MAVSDSGPFRIPHVETNRPQSPDQPILEQLPNTVISGITELEEQNAQLQAAVEAAQAKIARFESATATNAALMKNAFRTAADLMGRVRQLEDQNAQLRSALEPTQLQSAGDGQLESPEVLLKLALKATEGMLARMRGSERRVKELEEANVLLQSTLEETSGQLQSALEQACRDATRVEVVTTANAGLTAKVDEMQSANQQLRAALDQAKRDLAHLEGVESRNGELAQRVVALEEVNLRLESSLEGTRQEAGRLADAAKTNAEFAKIVFKAMEQMLSRAAEVPAAAMLALRLGQTKRVTEALQEAPTQQEEAAQPSEKAVHERSASSAQTSEPLAERLPDVLPKTAATDAPLVPASNGGPLDQNPDTTSTQTTPPRDSGEFPADADLPLAAVSTSTMIQPAQDGTEPPSTEVPDGFPTPQAPALAETAAWARRPGALLHQVPDLPSWPAPIALVVSPFDSFRSLASFQKALGELEGVRSARIRRFDHGTLHQIVEYTGEIPLAQRLTELTRFKPQILSVTRDRIELRIDGREPCPPGNSTLESL